MKNFTFILLCFLLSIAGRGQNLVPNSSFENFTTCPTSSGQLNYATPWNNPTSSGNPDYYNSCSSVIGVPFCNGAGTCYQLAHSGVAFSGIWCFSQSVSDGREYVQIQFSDSMLSGNCYYISFYTNLINWARFACNNMGVYVSNNQINLTGPTFLLPYTPQLKNFNNTIITDTMNWHKVSGIYIATGGEKYVTIGNFNTDASIDTIRVNSSTPADGAYYFIDDVSVIHIDSIIGSMAAFAGNDTTIINGDSVFIGQEISNLYCNWYIGATLIADSVSGLYVSPIVNTTYIVEQNLCGNITYDTVTVYVSGVGINENGWSKKINIYPNPNNGEFILELNETKSAQWNVFIADVQGREILRQAFNNNKVRLKLEAENGLYLIHITNTLTHETAVKKMIIQK